MASIILITSESKDLMTLPTKGSRTSHRHSKTCTKSWNRWLRTKRSRYCSKHSKNWTRNRRNQRINTRSRMPVERTMTTARTLAVLRILHLVSNKYLRSRLSLTKRMLHLRVVRLYLAVLAWFRRSKTKISRLSLSNKSPITRLLWQSLNLYRPVCRI